MNHKVGWSVRFGVVYIPDNLAPTVKEEDMEIVQLEELIDINKILGLGTEALSSSLHSRESLIYLGVY